MSEITVFFSYAHEDELLLDELKKHWRLLQRQGLINVWYDNTIDAGLEWQRERAAQLDTASIIALLISPDFLASDYIYSVEIQRAMQRHEAGEAHVIPILLKPVYWEGAPFAKLAPLPTNAIPITKWPDQNEAFLAITKSFRTILDNLEGYSSAAQIDANEANSSTEWNISKEEEKLTPPTKSIGTTIYTYDIHTKWVSAIAWSPDGRYIASAGGDGAVRIWESATGHHFLTYRGHSGMFFATTWDMKWSPDGRMIASSGHGSTVRVWDATTGQDLVLYNDYLVKDPLAEGFTLAWSPDSMRIVSAACHVADIDQTVHVWNAATGRTLLKYTQHATGLPSFVVSDVAWSPNGKYIASGGTDKSIKKWKINPMKFFRTVQIWDPNTGVRLVTCDGSSDFIHAISWSPDSKYVAAAESEGQVCVWDVTTGAIIQTYKGHTKSVRAVAWSPHSSCIASSSDDHTVQLWQAMTGKLMYVYRTHTGHVTALAWSPDGTRIASAGSDSTVQIWQAV